MSTSAPALSVTMPVYNAERYLGEAIDSVLAQTFTDFEFLIIDDGSSDGSAAIIESYAARDSRIRFKSRENRGGPATRNELAGMARAPLLAVMDADDVCHSERFEKQMAYLEAHPDVDVLGTGAIFTDHKGRPIFSEIKPLTHDEIDASNLKGGTAFMHPTVIMRHHAFDAVGGYDEDFPASQDLDLWLRLAEVARLANLPDTLLNYRLIETSVSGGHKKRQAELAATACRNAWERRGLPSRPLADAHWRPGKDRASKRDFALKWGWRAWKEGHRTTARHMFWKALRTDPLSANAWKGLVFGTLRQPETREPRK